MRIVYLVPALALKPISFPYLLAFEAAIRDPTVARIPVMRTRMKVMLESTALMMRVGRSLLPRKKMARREASMERPVRTTSTMRMMAKALMTRLSVSRALWTSSLKPMSSSVSLKGPTRSSLSRMSDTLKPVYLLVDA